ncbi:hypothetical protein C7S15_5476 [Burkholderia cepacia]|nr:hypothetical protein [Burkholderia cepacia]
MKWLRQRVVAERPNLDHRHRLTENTAHFIVRLFGIEQCINVEITRE